MCGGRSAKLYPSVSEAILPIPLASAVSAARSESAASGIDSRGRAKSIPNLRLVGTVGSLKQRRSHPQPRSVGGSPINRSATTLPNAVFLSGKDGQPSEGVGVNHTCRLESSDGGSGRDSSTGVPIDACRTVSIGDDAVGNRLTKSGDSRSATRSSIRSRGRSTSMTIQGSTPCQVL